MHLTEFLPCLGLILGGFVTVDPSVCRLGRPVPERERTPYEADAYINQFCQYAVDDDYSLARKSHEWLMEHPTWPTERKQHSVTVAVSGKRLSVTVPAPATVIWNGRSHEVAADSHDFE